MSSPGVTAAEWRFWVITTVVMGAVAALEIVLYLGEVPTDGIERLGFCVATIVYTTQSFLNTVDRRRRLRRCWHG